MLSRDISDLAARSLAATLNERRTAFPRKIQTIQAELAAKGIVGGTTLRLVSDAAQAECEARIDIATAELQRAADSKGVRYHPGLAKDLGDELSELTQNLCQDVEAVGTTALHVIPNAKGGVGIFQSAVQEAVRGRLYRGRTDLEHYAESVHTREREQARAARLKVWQGSIIALISALITAAVAFLVARFVKGVCI